jgi:adenylate kinase
VFDGFPRTVAQAELLVRWLARHDRKVDLVLNLVVPDEAIVARLSQRRSCLSCGATYHLTSKPPAEAGVCDACGGEVVQRSDDRAETVEKRIAVYHRETRPVLDWLRDNGTVVDINADQAIDQVEADLLAALGR